MVDSVLVTLFVSSFRIHGCYFNKSHGLLHLQVSYMVSKLTFSYSRWFSSPFTFCDFCNLGSMAEALTREKWSLKIHGVLSLLHVSGNQVSCFPPDRAHIVPSLPLITNVPIVIFPLAIDVLGKC